MYSRLYPHCNRALNSHKQILLPLAARIVSMESNLGAHSGSRRGRGYQTAPLMIGVKKVKILIVFLITEH